MNEDTALGTKDFIERRLSAIKNQRSTGELEDLALIIGEYPRRMLEQSIKRPFRWQEFDICPRKGYLQGLFGIGYVV